MVSMRDIPRDDLDLVQVVETPGEKANSYCIELKAIEIPADMTMKRGLRSGGKRKSMSEKIKILKKEDLNA